VARIDDYNKALGLAKEELRSRNPLHVCRLSGGLCIEKEARTTDIRLMFLDRIVQISWPDLAFHHASGSGEVPIKQQILMLHYLNNATKENLTGELISYQDIPSAKFYLDAFNRRVRYPLINTFGDQPHQLLQIAKELFGATQSSLGDISIQIQALPKVPITFVLWRGDEEFPPDGTILFDSSIKDILSAEDISELASQIVYPLITKAK
jgi:hypothetical protein